MATPAQRYAAEQRRQRLRQRWQVQRARGFTPFKAPGRPPAGTYDPSLDAQERATQRGLGDLRLDTERDREWGQNDLLTAQSDADRDRARFGEDLGLRRADVERDYSRSLGDLLTDRRRTGEDYRTSIGALDRRFASLGNRQAQSIVRMGAQGGGAFAQAAAKRATNQGIERQPLDTAFGRANEDSRLRESRLGENRQLALDDLARTGTRFTEDSDQRKGRLSQMFEREFGAQGMRTLGLARGEREANHLGLDLNEVRFHQATQSGLYNPPQRPSNEFTKGGQTYRLVRTPSGRLVRLLPNGQIRDRQGRPLRR